jgi:hypothetical protein
LLAQPGQWKHGNMVCRVEEAVAMVKEDQPDEPTLFGEEQKDGRQTSNKGRKISCVLDR